MEINKLMRRDLERCEKLYRKLKNEFDYLEEGSLYLKNGTYRWCTNIDGKHTSRTIRDKELIDRLKKRQYIKRGLPVLEERMKNCADYLRKDVFYDPLQVAAKMPLQYNGLKNMDIFLEGDVNT